MTVQTAFRVLDAHGRVVAGDDLYGVYLERRAVEVGGVVVDVNDVQVFPEVRS